MPIIPSRSWPRLLAAIGLPGLLLSALMILLVTRGLPWYGWVSLVVAVLWFAWSLVHALLDMREIAHRSEVKDQSVKSEPSPSNELSPNTLRDLEGKSPLLISLVYLLDDAREPTVASVRRLLEVSLGYPFDGTESELPGFVTKFESDEKEPVERFFFRTEEGAFCLLACPDPYIENPREFARTTIRDKRLRRAVESHSAWISVDYAETPEQTDLEEKTKLYGVIGKIASAMAGPDCLAVYCPELQRCNEFDLDMMERLREDDPRRIFTEPTHEPIIEISENNPRMKAAVDEAINRWPEFVAAFRRQDGAEDQSFIAKAEFVSREDATNSEFMWINVTAASAESLEGVLMNEPHDLPDLHKGKAVTVMLKHLNDWIFPGPDGNPIGGFTLSVLSDDGE